MESGKVLQLDNKPEEDWYAVVCSSQSDSVVLRDEDRDTFNAAFEQMTAESFDESHRNFKSLAKKGSSHSQYYLGLMHLRGLGVLQDFRRAHMWLNIASSNNHAKARQQLEKLTKGLSNDLVTEAQKAAQRWVSKFKQRTESQA